MESDEYPVLGENPAVDLANTWYSSGAEVVDYLETQELVRGWWEALALETATPVPSAPAWTHRDHQGLIFLRDAVREVLLGVVDGTRPGPAALATINGWATRAPVRRLLAVAPDRRPSALVVQDHAAEGAPGVLGLLADSCIRLFHGAESPVVRRCEGPGCPMLFIRHHARRRHCHPSCAHRGRQARYYQRHRAAR